ncbi:MAG: universal stress protein [Pseudomonadota bacterium]
MYDRILIVVDDASTSEHALQEGLALAQAHGAAVVLLGVMPTAGAPVSDLPMMGVVGQADFEPLAREDTERRLQAAADAATRAGVRSRSLVGDGLDPVHSIAQTAESLGCDLIVVGSEGRNAVMRLLTGSVIPGLITHARVPVLVCRDCSRGARTMRLAGTDAPIPRRRAGTGPAQA